MSTVDSKVRQGLLSLVEIIALKPSAIKILL